MSQLAILPRALVGRDRELGFLQEFFRQAAVSGGALFLSGDPGVGKTALLNVLAGSTAAPERQAAVTTSSMILLRPSATAWCRSTRARA